MSEDHYKAFFREADADGSGFLTLDELSATLRRKGYAGSDAKIRSMFQAVDTSGDNEISYEEYMIAMNQMSPKDHKAAAMRSCFRGFDKNGDGQIDRSELEAVFRELGRCLSTAELDRIMEMADKDKSGAIDYEEFIKEIFGA